MIRVMIRIIGKTKMPLSIHGKSIRFGETVDFDNLTNESLAHANALERLELISMEYVNNNIVETPVESTSPKAKRKTKLVE